MRGFAREVGTTPHAYLMQRRVRLACQLLGAGRPIVEAAINAGFADQSHLTRAFVRQFGVTQGALWLQTPDRDLSAILFKTGCVIPAILPSNLFCFGDAQHDPDWRHSALSR